MNNDKTITGRDVERWALGRLLEAQTGRTPMPTDVAESLALELTNDFFQRLEEMRKRIHPVSDGDISAPHRRA